MNCNRIACNHKSLCCNRKRGPLLNLLGFLHFYFRSTPEKIYVNPRQISGQTFSNF